MSSVLVTGGAGQVGRAVGRRGAARGIEVQASTVDVTDAEAVDAEISFRQPSVVIHCGALTDVDRCESEPTLAWQVNVSGTAHVANSAHGIGAHLIYVSTNFVFDGTSSTPYKESDPARPINIYGETKLGGELVVGPEASIIRSGWVCGDGPRNLVAAVLRGVERRQPMHFVDDCLGQPTEADQLADALLDLGTERLGGTWNLTGPDVMTPLQVARLVLDLLGEDPDLVGEAGTGDPVRSRPAARPANGTLDLGRWIGAGRTPLAPFAETLPALIDRIRSR